MNKANRILVIVFLTVIFAVLGFYGWFLYSKKTSKTAKPSLPNVSSLNAVNLPGKLFGPEEATKANKLDNQKIIDWTNKYRADENLPALTLNTNLAAAAQAKTDDMFAKQYFEHTSTTGVTTGQLVLDEGYNYKVTGQNLALGDFKDEKDLVDAWMASPGHRANIMNTEYTEIGVAAGLSDYQGRNTWIAVQEFGKPAPNCTTPSSITVNQIDTDKAKYQTLSNNLSQDSADAQSFFDQANAKIAQGNQIYAQTHSKAKAQPYWDEGSQLQKQAQAKLAEAQQIDAQMKDLYNKINDLVNRYNVEVNSYNYCIK